MKKILFILTILSTSVFAKIEIGDDMSHFSFPDQFDKIHTVSQKTAKMIFAFRKHSGHSLKEFLATKDSNYLNDKNIMNIADVSAMPTVIQWFALPSLKNYQFPIILLNNDNLSDTYKKNETNIEKIIVVILNNSIVTNIKYFDTTKELEKYLLK